MAKRFADSPDRKKIDKAGLVSIYTRLFGAPDPKFTKPRLERDIKTFGICQCDNKACKTPFKGYCEYDHMNPNAVAVKGEAIYWRALTKACHGKKTHGPRGDTNTVAHLARIAHGNTQYDKRERNGSKLAKPDGYKHQWPKGQKIQGRKKGEYKSNVKVID